LEDYITFWKVPQLGMTLDKVGFENRIVLESRASAYRGISVGLCALVFAMSFGSYDENNVWQKAVASIPFKLQGQWYYECSLF